VNSYLLRTTYKAELERIRARPTAVAGAGTDEIALHARRDRGPAELIAGYNRLRLGSAVMYANLDYYSCQYAMNWLRGRRGVEVLRIVIPEPPTRQNVETTRARCETGPAPF
jgi:isopenicillin-N epimerase